MILIYQSPVILSFRHPYNPQPPTNSHPLASPTKAAIPEAATLSRKVQVKTTGLERIFLPKYITCLVVPVVPRKNVLKVYFLFFVVELPAGFAKTMSQLDVAVGFSITQMKNFTTLQGSPQVSMGKQNGCFDVWKDVSPRENMVRILTKPA